MNHSFVDYFNQHIDPDVAMAARAFCRDTENVEYVRGQAELIIDTTIGLTMDDKELLMEWLVEEAPMTRHDQIKAALDRYHTVKSVWGYGDTDHRPRDLTVLETLLEAADEMRDVLDQLLDEHD